MSTSMRLRRWWQFRLSLRAMMVLILVVAVPLGWKVRRAAVQRRAVLMVHEMDGSVGYEDEIGPPFRPRFLFGEPRSWWRRWLGDEYFREVAWVGFGVRHAGRQLDDESIAVLNDFDRLQGIVIWGPKNPPDQPPRRLITARGLARLANFPRLRTLRLLRVGTDEAMVRELTRWPGLEQITVIDEPKTLPGSSLRHLGKLSQLRDLEMTSVASSAAADLAPLLSLSHLERIVIDRAPVDDGGLSRLGTSRSLRILDLAGTEVTAPTLAGLTRSPHLVALRFHGSRLPRGGLRTLAGGSPLQRLTVLGASKHWDDADLDDLESVPLRHLTLTGMDATDAGVNRLLASHSFETLALSGRGISDASIPTLGEQTELRTLTLAGTSITDDGLAGLATLAALQTLSLIDNSRLTEDGLVSLSSSPALCHLMIRQAGVQSSTLDALRAARVRSRTLTITQPPDEVSR